MNSKAKLGIWTLILLVVLVWVAKVFDKNDLDQKLGLSFNSGLVKGVSFSQKWSFDFSKDKAPQNDPELEKIINENLKDKEGEFAIVVESLTDPNKKSYLNPQKILPAGSFYKLYLLATAYDQINQGKLKKEDTVTASVDHLVEVLGEKEFGYEDVNSDQIDYSIAQVLPRIATISDNYASIMLAEKVGWDEVRNQAKAVGATSTIVKSPISTTALDTANFFKKLYEGKIVSKEASNEILDLLSQSRLNNRIPAKLSETGRFLEASKSAEKKLVIAHKTAELPRIRHDAGIVFLENNPYIIILMGTNLKHEDNGVETLADISKAIFDYMSK